VPLRSRKLDGAVEGANGSWRYKRHAIYDLPDSLITLNALIEGFQYFWILLVSWTRARP